MSNKIFISIIFHVMLMVALVMLNGTNTFGNYTIYALSVIAILSVLNAGYVLNAVAQERKQTAQNAK